MSGANTVMPYVFGGLGLGHLTQQLRSDEEDRKKSDVAAPVTAPATTPKTVEEFNAASYERQMRKKAYLASIEGEGTIEKKSLLGG